MACIKVFRAPVHVAVALIFLTAGGAGEAGEVFEIQQTAEERERRIEPDWFEVFDGSGKLRLESFVQPGLRDAVFIEDRVSWGNLTDISALAPTPAPEDQLVYNAPVPTPHDLGNAYLIAEVQGIDLRLDLRIERLSGDEGDSSFVEIELNRDVVALSSGHRFSTSTENPAGYELRWPFRGERSDGDLTLRVDLQGRDVTSMQLRRWNEIDGVGGFQLVEAGENLAGGRCFGVESIYTVCGGALVPDKLGRTFISNGDPEQPYAPESFVQIAFNLGSLTGSEPDFSTVTVRTPRDIAFGSFRAFGHFKVQDDDLSDVAGGSQ